MCDDLEVKTISIRQLQIETRRWVRRAVSRGAIIVADRGRPVATLQPFHQVAIAKRLPNREAAIRRRSRVPVDSAVYQADLREERSR
jgi:antitoxin (DNA-binding transcriptional repressor) of toxin-antitoxin stability system